MIRRRAHQRARPRARPRAHLPRPRYRHRAPWGGQWIIRTRVVTKLRLSSTLSRRMARGTFLPMRPGDQHSAWDWMPGSSPMHRHPATTWFLRLSCFPATGPLLKLRSTLTRAQAVASHTQMCCRSSTVLSRTSDRQATCSILQKQALLMRKPVSQCRRIPPFCLKCATRHSRVTAVRPASTLPRGRGRAVAQLLHFLARPLWCASIQASIRGST